MLALEEGEGDAIGIMIKLTTFLRFHKTSDDMDTINELKNKITEKSILNSLLRKSLQTDNWEHLYQFFKELESGRAVFTLLRWFKKETNPKLKILLGRFAIVSCGDNLRSINDLVIFGMELPDRDAVSMFKAFREEGALNTKDVLQRWSGHTGFDTQVALLEYINSQHPPSDEAMEVLRLYADGVGTRHRNVQQSARAILDEKYNRVTRRF